MSVSKPGTFGVFAGFVAPTIAGAVVAWFFNYSMRRRGTDVTQRLLIFVGAVFAIQFADVYAAAFHTSGLSLSPTLAPNATFVVGLVLYLVLRIDTSGTGRGTTLGGGSWPFRRSQRLDTLDRGLPQRGRRERRKALAIKPMSLGGGLAGLEVVAAYILYLIAAAPALPYVLLLVSGSFRTWYGSTFKGYDVWFVPLSLAPGAIFVTVRLSIVANQLMEYGKKRAAAAKAAAARAAAAQRFARTGAARAAGSSQTRPDAF